MKRRRKKKKKVIEEIGKGKSGEKIINISFFPKLKGTANEQCLDPTTTEFTNI